MRARPRFLLTLSLAALAACTASPPAPDDPPIEVVLLFAGPVQGGARELQTSLWDAEEGESLENVWGSGASPSCEPDSRFVFAFVLRSSRKDPFMMHLTRQYVFDDLWELRKISTGATGDSLTGYVYTRLVDGLSGPFYYSIRNWDGVQPDGVIRLLRRGRVLFEHAVEYDC